MANQFGQDTSTWSRFEKNGSGLTDKNLAKIAEIFKLRIIDVITYPDIYVNSKREVKKEKLNLFYSLN